MKSRLEAEKTDEPLRHSEAKPPKIYPWLHLTK